MPTTVALVSCVKQKRRDPAPARDLYTSPLFRGLRAHAERCADTWYILSAEHGLLDPAREVAPYERTLNRMPRAERLTWAERVQRQLVGVVPHEAHVTILAGERYREHLVPFLKRQGCRVEIPLEKMRMGEQLRRLKQLSAAGDAV